MLNPGLYLLFSPRFPFRYLNDYLQIWILIGYDNQDISINCIYNIQSVTGIGCNVAHLNLSINDDVHTWWQRRNQRHLWLAKPDFSPMTVFAVSAILYHHRAQWRGSRGD